MARIATDPKCPHPPGVAVFCGARTGASKVFLREAETLGRGLAKRRLRVVFGGGDTGLMGALAAAVDTAGGEMLGVVPEDVFTTGIPPGARHIVTVPSLRERKALMRVNADILLAMAGGIGTLDEVVESLVERQLGRHRKPIVLMDSDGCWDELGAVIEAMVKRGFVEPSAMGMLTMAANADDALAHIDRLLPGALSNSQAALA